MEKKTSFENGLGAVHHDSAIERYDEDKRMLAFFDSLLQRELSGRDDDDDDDDSDGLSLVFSRYPYRMRLVFR